MVVVIFCVWLGLPIMINVFLPKYIPSIPIIKILVPSAFFLSLTAIPCFYLVTIGKQRLIIAYLLCAMLTSLIVDYYLVKAGYEIIGVAFGAAAGYFVYGCICCITAIYFATKRFMRTFKMLIVLFIPFMALVVSSVLFDLVVFQGTLSDRYGLHEFYRLLFVGGSLMLMLWFVNRDGELMSIVRNDVMPAFKKLWKRSES